MNPELKWMNIFLRDLLLLVVVSVVNWYIQFKSWAAAFLAGMLVVLISWHFEDYLKSKQEVKLK